MLCPANCGKNDYRLPWSLQDPTTRQSAHTDLPLTALLRKDSRFFCWSDCNSSPFNKHKRKNGILCADPVPRGRRETQRGEVKETNGRSTSKRRFHCLINRKHNKRKEMFVRNRRQGNKRIEERDSPSKEFYELFLINVTHGGKSEEQLML